ncbi:Uncharacterised protein [Yersinia enterocolitica]|uniref:Uncharacterized protein n=3 Tax=Yersinia enterocolitica TaxID=630 RepID=A0A0E1NEB1_YEREN|nr:hypothetical protein CH48_1661 [Yersinia enterocolitica]CBX71949.1 unknown protein [Yersinia enterocolitica W22703]ALG80602.1 hypothetical protein XM56_20355 [Yersinia enterocolitica]EKN5045477.1 hypothetical protein [Yersinia enterocolitica]EKN6030096.1 hypothetical protein [Yersinia enterocolitica]
MTEKCTEYYSYMTTNDELNKFIKYQTIKTFFWCFFYPIIHKKLIFSAPTPLIICLFFVRK